MVKQHWRSQSAAELDTSNAAVDFSNIDKAPEKGVVLPLIHHTLNTILLTVIMRTLTAQDMLITLRT